MGGRSLEVRVSEKEAQLEKALQKAEQYRAQLKQLQSRKRNEDQRQRTHSLIVCGAELAALYGKVLDKDEVLTVVDFLRRQKENGIFTIPETKPESQEASAEDLQEMDTENGNLFNGLFDF